MEKVSPVRLFLSFLKLGITAFGGPAMIVHIRELSVARNRWLSMESFKDGVVLCQSMPGATAMQMAGYVGLLAFLLMLGLSIFTPSFVILVAVTPFFDCVKGSKYFAGATRGILASFVGLLFCITIRFAIAVP